MKKIRLEAGERERREEDGQEDVEHALLRVLGADVDDGLAVLDRGLLDGGVELDVLLDELDRAVRARGDGLHGCAREPVDDGAAHDEAEQERRVQDRELVEIALQAVGQEHDDREDHRGGADDGRADEDGLGRGLERVARAVVLLEEVLRLVEAEVEAEVALDLGLDVGDVLDDRELVDRLGVVGHGAVRVDRDRDRAHAEEAEGDEAERERRPARA